jgi:hypothetical protein
MEQGLRLELMATFFPFEIQRLVGQDAAEGDCHFGFAIALPFRAK